MVFQSYALYPHMTVADNMGFALKIAGMNKSEIRSRVEEAARILHLTPFLDRMGDRVAVLKDGLLARCDTPLRLYQQPADVFVAGFIGSPGMNIAEFKLDGTDAVNGRARVRLPTSTVSALGEAGTDRVVVAFHPEDVDLVSEHAESAFPVDVALVEELGSDAFLYGTPAGGDADTQIIGRVDARNPPSKGAGPPAHPARPGTLLLAGHRHPVCPHDPGRRGGGLIGVQGGRGRLDRGGGGTYRSPVRIPRRAARRLRRRGSPPRRSGWPATARAAASRPAARRSRPRLAGRTRRVR
jgi:hypothetical protein